LEQTVNDSGFRTCPGCNKLTPADNPQCAHCGFGSIEAVDAAQYQAASERRFLQALFTRSNPFTMIFIGVNAGVFLLMCLAGGFAVTSPDSAVLIAFGAKQNNLIAEQHQYWRLITPIFIHIGIIHLLLNNYALWIIGQEIERIYGSARFVTLYLITGVIGSIGSYTFNPQATSAGASGAIFGLFGALAAFAFRYRKEIPEFLSREIKRRVLPIIAINLIFGFSVRIVDNAAHIGGLLSGVALALAVPYKRPSERITPLMWRALQVVCLAVIFVSFADAFRSYNGPPLRFSNLTRSPGSSVVSYFDNMKEAHRSFVESGKAFATVLNTQKQSGDVKPAIDGVERGIRAVNAAPQVDSQADLYRKRLLDLLSEQKNILDQYAQPSSKNLSALANEEDALIDHYNQFASDYGKWLPGFLKEHGYELGGSPNR
jgi:membrane associated rhomboid family serine protease